MLEGTRRCGCEDLQVERANPDSSSLSEAPDHSREWHLSDSTPAPPWCTYARREIAPADRKAGSVMPSHPSLKAMAHKIAAARTASTMDQPRTRHAGRRSFDRTGRTSVRPSSRCLAADISASLLHEKDGSPRVPYFPAIRSLLADLAMMKTLGLIPLCLRNVIHYHY